MEPAPFDATLIGWCTRELGAEPVRELFRTRQTGQVTAYRLSDGRRVVVKLRHDPIPRVNDCLALQSALFAGHYSCPRPLTDASLLGGLTAHAEQLVEGGEMLLGTDDELAPAFAAAYADLINRLERMTGLVDPERLGPPPWVGWWRRRPWAPHDRVPALVDTAAATVRGLLRGAGPGGVVGHADWESQNLRWVGERLRVAFDWDSLTWLPEAMLVGAAASTFPSGAQPVVASITATESFLEDYQRHRRPLSDAELKTTWAAGLLPVLFNARTEALERKRPMILDELSLQVEERLRRAGA